MSGRVRIKPRVKEDRRDKRIREAIRSRFKNLQELMDLIDTNTRSRTVKIRDGAGFREVPRGGYLHLNYLARLEEELGTKISINLLKYL